MDNDISDAFFYKRLRDRYRTETITLKQIREFLSLDYCVNHLIPKHCQRDFIKELEDKKILEKIDNNNFKIVVRRDLLKKVIRLTLQ